jgi:DNA polymerase-3 subunit epsilon
VKWLRRHLGSKRLRAAHAAALEAYDREPVPPGAGMFMETRFVVVDVETTGLRPYHDRLLAIGAVCVDRGLIRLHDTFEVTLRQDEPSAPENILVHGIDGTTQTSGVDAADALVAFLAFARKAPLVAFHAEFDRVFVTRAMREALSAGLENSWLDLADLAPALVPEHADHAQTLDDWTSIFAIENTARHQALADAVATAQLLQVVLGRASQAGLSRLAELTARAKERRWLVHSLKNR